VTQGDQPGAAPGPAAVDADARDLAFIRSLPDHEILVRLWMDVRQGFRGADWDLDAIRLVTDHLTNNPTDVTAEVAAAVKRLQAIHAAAIAAQAALHASVSPPIT
jgi:hypothetical protein